MNIHGEPWMTRHVHYFSDPDAGPDAMLNDATEWLKYAHTSIQFLAELVHERGSPDAQRLPIMPISATAGCARRRIDWSASRRCR